MANHALDERMGHVVEGEEVGGQNALELCGLHEHQQVVLADTGVVDQHFDIVVRMGGLPVLQGSLGLFGTADVKFEQLAIGAGLADHLQRFLSLSIVGHIVYQHIVAHLRQSHGDGSSYSSASAGN